MTVVEYMNKYEELKIKCQGVKDPRQILSRFKAGLRAEIRTQIIPHRIYNVDEAFQLELKIEKSMRQPFNKRISCQASKTIARRPNEAGRNSKPTPPNN